MFIRERHGMGHLWLRSVSKITERQLTSDDLNVLEATVNDAGDVIASIGPVANPMLISLPNARGGAHALEWSRNDRFPAYSPDGKRLAFSRRDHGAWHLRIRDLASGNERQLTHGPCNAVQPSWSAPDSLLYATDCGRGLGLSAIAQIHL